ncbi:MAG: hypothetical protein KTR25_08045 [Myxococcales bacterium]|nr:hypothetical protein [Myxococcales bacterium]
MPKPPYAVTGLPSANDIQTYRDTPRSGRMEDQLRDLYAQRQELQRALGTADSTAIIAMVRSLERQLEDLYRLFEGRAEQLPNLDDDQ